MMPSVEERLLAKFIVDEKTGCWDWTAGKIRNGYGHLWVGGKTKKAHRISFEIHRGPIPSGMFVCHSCDNRSCVNPAHLFLGTNVENMADMVAKARQARGTNIGRAKLTDADVIAIRDAKGISNAKLGRMYGVSGWNIAFIRSGKGWAHLTQQDGD